MPIRWCNMRVYDTIKKELLLLRDQLRVSDRINRDSLQDTLLWMIQISKEVLDVENGDGNTKGRGLGAYRSRIEKIRALGDK